MRTYRHKGLILFAFATLGLASAPPALTPSTRPSGGLPPGFQWLKISQWSFVSTEDLKGKKPALFTPDDRVDVTLSPAGRPQLPTSPIDKTRPGNVGGREVTWLVTVHNSGYHQWLEWETQIVPTPSQGQGPGWPFDVRVKITGESAQSVAALGESLKSLHMSDP